MNLQLLEHEPPAPTQRDQWLPQIAKLWSGPEVDEIWAVLKPGESIVSIGWAGVTVSLAVGESRQISRADLRLRSRPSYSDKSPEQWIAMTGPPIVDPQCEVRDERIIYSEQRG